MKYWLILDLSDHTYIFVTSQNSSSQHYEDQVPHLFPLCWNTENPWDSRFNFEYITEEQALTPPEGTSLTTAYKEEPSHFLILATFTSEPTLSDIETYYPELLL